MAHTQITGHHDRQMFKAHPRGTAFDESALAACIESCLDCGQTCITCADACSAEADPKHLARCIRRNLDCAELCFALARVLGRQTEPDAGVIRSTVEACRVACAACAQECEGMKDMEHCRICAEVCRACEQACTRLAGVASA